MKKLTKEEYDRLYNQEAKWMPQFFRPMSREEANEDMKTNLIMCLSARIREAVEYEGIIYGKD